VNRTVKVILDIVMGAVVPILILRYLSEPIGTIEAYLLAAFVPVAWVSIDLFFITRRFNFITSYTALFAIVNGLLAFWFVDGLLYAFKDSVAFIITVALFGGSVLVGKPFIKFFITQVLNPETPERTAQLKRLLRQPKIYRALIIGSLIFAGVNLLTGTINFFLNLYIVTAEFGTVLFNEQVATVNAITRFVLNIPEVIGMVVAVWLIITRIYGYLGTATDTSPYEVDFWELVEKREAQQAQPDTTEWRPPPADGTAAPAGPAHD
jgi:hypothetical protein